jgi:creatinine amidohydrolase/Fe(II)-dependent formamide hydrolase-like protein
MRALAALLLALHLPAVGSAQAGSPDPDSPRPIDIHDTVWLEDLTWMEVRDLMREGWRTVLIPTGGVEQNGPYLALGKHNIILRATMDAVARRLGEALVAPVVPFVPEGEHSPATGHMRYPGTVSVTEETFRALLTDIAESMRTHGFEHVILLGDSGGNREGMAAVASELSTRWRGSGTRIHYVPEYYEFDYRGWLAERGITEVDEGLHDDVRHSALMMLVDPTTVRMEERERAGLFTINGVELAPVERTLELARRLTAAQADVTVDAIRRRMRGGE